jgi:hypothetical protein
MAAAAISAMSMDVASQPSVAAEPAAEPAGNASIDTGFDASPAPAESAGSMWDVALGGATMKTDQGASPSAASGDMSSQVAATYSSFAMGG